MFRITSNFDKADRLAPLTDWTSRTVSYRYVPDGHLQSTTYVHGTTTTNTEDNAQRLTQVWNKQGTGTTIGQHTYTLDNVGTRTQVAESLAQVGCSPLTVNTAYRYDTLYRLMGDGTTTYGYDPVSNRTSMGATTYAYD